MNEQNVPAGELMDTQIIEVAGVFALDALGITNTLRIARAVIAADRALRASPAAGDVAMPVIGAMRKIGEPGPAIPLYSRTVSGIYPIALTRQSDAQAALAAQATEIAELKSDGNVRYMDLLSDVLDAKTVMRAAGVKQESFAKMFLIYSAQLRQALDAPEPTDHIEDVRDMVKEEPDLPLTALVTESDMLTYAEAAGFLPNTIYSWMPALTRYTNSVLAAGRAAAPASDELIRIHAVVLSIGGDWPEVDGDPYTLAHVKRMARDLSGFMDADLASSREKQTLPLTAPVTDDEIDAAYQYIDVHGGYIDGDDMRKLLEGFAAIRAMQVSGASTAFVLAERERCAALASSMTKHMRRVRAGVNGVALEECEISAAIRKGPA